MTHDLSEHDRRLQADRRAAPTSLCGALPPAGQRLRNRRADEHRRPYFVDRFSAATFLLVVMLLTASLVDAILTIHLLRAGAHEINPLMDRLLSHGVQTFLLVKYVLTATGLPLLLIFQHHYLFGTRLRVGYFLPLAVSLYLLLITYQLTLLWQYAA